jgi:CubicO group peptidase (beta-lactamase class C family)
MINRAKKLKLQDKDYAWAYSNFGMALLGEAIGACAGKSFYELINQFFQDLGMESTSAGTHPDLMKSYDANGKNSEHWHASEKESLIPAGIGMVSTAEDLLHFAKINMEEAHDYLKLCHESHAKVNDRFEMGLGWWKIPQDGIICHGGDTDGFSTMLSFTKEKEIAIVFLANLQNQVCETERFPLITGILNDIK